MAVQKIALALCALAVPCAARLGASPVLMGDAEANKPALQRLNRFLTRHSDANVVELDLNCSSLMLPKFEKNSVDACRSMLTHQTLLHSIVGDVIDMLGRKRNVKTTQKVNVVEVGGELGASALTIAQHDNVASLYSIQPNTDVSEFLQRVADKNRLEHFHVINRVLATDGAKYKNAVDKSQAPVEGRSFDRLVEDKEVPEHIDLILLGESEMIAQQVVGSEKTISDMRPVLVTAVRLPRDKMLVENIRSIQKLGYASFSVDESCAVSSNVEGLCRNIVHVPVGDSYLQESIHEMLKDRMGVTLIDPQASLEKSVA